MAEGYRREWCEGRIQSRSKVILVWEVGLEPGADARGVVPVLREGDRTSPGHSTGGSSRLDGRQSVAEENTL